MITGEVRPGTESRRPGASAGRLPPGYHGCITRRGCGVARGRPASRPDGAPVGRDRTQDTALASHKWAALPSFAFWLFLMIAIWLFLLGWARIVSETFTLTEIAMTIGVGAASTLGIVTGLRMRTATRRAVATATVLGVTVLDLIAFRVSLLPAIAHR